MTWLFAILIVLAMGGVAAVAAGRGGPLAPAYDDRPDAAVPSTGPVGPDDLRRVRFSLALRGYRMGEVDALLDRLARQLEEQGTVGEDPVKHPVERGDRARPEPGPAPETPPV